MVVNGSIGIAVLADIDGFEVQSVGSQTVLLGAGADQADLYGLLRRLERVGIDLVSIEQVMGTD